MSIDDEVRDRAEWEFEEHHLSSTARSRMPALEKDLVGRAVARRSARRHRNATIMGGLLLAVVSTAFVIVDRGSIGDPAPESSELVDARGTADSGEDAVRETTSGVRILVIDGVNDPDLPRPAVQIISQDRLLSILAESGTPASIRCDDAASICELSLLGSNRS